MNTEHVLLTDKDGNVKYFRTEQGAWNQCAKLNASDSAGQWLFEHEYDKGWFCEYFAD